MSEKRFVIRARNFIKQNGLKGPSGFLKYVILTYIKSINKVSEDFIFKGGNLIWYYIRTPRATVDLDLVTRSLNNKDDILKKLKKACKVDKGINYKILDYLEFEKEDLKAAKLKIAYKTDDGAENEFEIDIVYKLKTEYEQILLDLDEEKFKINAQSLENILSDKIDTCYKFKSGNTRIKDFDDIYRIIKSDLIPIKATKEILNKKGINNIVETSWINEDMEKAYKKHQKRYSDLPETLEHLFKEINIKLKI
ncbi:MAG: nucleotidyl transferase AbiEii/AbiGii toxin family protein [Pseudomonadota bacterium]